MRLTQFGATTLPEANAEDSFPVQARSSLVNLPNGAFDMDGSKLYFESGKIVRRTEVNGDAIDPVMNALLKELGKGRNILRALWRDDVTEMVTWGKLTNVTRRVDVDTYDCKTPITITWEQDYPFWLDASTGWFFDTGEFFDSGLFFDGTYYQHYTSTTPYNFTLTNTGSVAVPAGTTVIIPRPGVTLTNPKITNLTNQMSFMWTGVLAAGERLVIDWLTRTIEKDGDSEYANLTLGGDKQVRWMELETGDNSMRLTGTIVGGLVDLFFIYSPHFL